MSLLQNQDFVIYRIRNRYLQCMKDGVGERLITVNPTALNVPGFRNAGWGNPSELRRTHSPPIPVGTSGDYFAAAPRSAGEAPSGYNDAIEDPSKAFGLPERIGRGERIPRRMREVLRDDDDSSDASDDSDDEETVQGFVGKSHPADSNANTISSTTNQLKFVKRPLRTRSGSSPIRSGPQVLVTSPSSRPRDSRTRAGSHGTFDLTRVGSLSRVSSDLVRPVAKADQINGAASEALLSTTTTRIRDADSDKFRALTERLNRSPSSSYYTRDRSLSFDLDDSGDDSDASTTLSSDFTETADSNPIVIGHALSSSFPTGLSSPSILHALPPPRPISTIQPVSALTQMIKAKQAEIANPMETYRVHSGKGELSHLTLKIYFNKLQDAKKPLVVLLKKQAISTDDAAQPREIAVVEAIGFSLYRYIEEGRQPPLTPEQMDVNRWAFKIVEEDGEPDDDFPPLIRTRPLTSYMVRGRRGIEKLEGEFAMVEATPEQYEEHQRQTPGQRPSASTKSSAGGVPVQTNNSNAGNLVLAPSERQVAQEASSSIARTGPSKILRIFINSVDDFAQSVSICVTTDTYIGEVLEQVCKKKKLAGSSYILKLHQKNILAPLDRMVETLGENTDLDLVRKKFTSDGLGDRPGSPSSADPNTPLSISNPVVPSKKKRLMQPNANIPDVLSSVGYQKFIVWRKQPMSFMSRHERVLAIDGEYVHIMPSEQRTIFESPKTVCLPASSLSITICECQLTCVPSVQTSIHISAIIGCKVYKKAPTNFKIAVMKPQPREPKRYDFEATTAAQAVEIVSALKKQIDTYKLDHVMRAG
ncbi:stress-activated map kinase interacting protein 1-domain-containing protein [Peziza echinospora]|nr:stress-activated map kinase interacting protein 1-domain-containing protein [Peziza echinospora]